MAFELPWGATNVNIPGVADLLNRNPIDYAGAANTEAIVGTQGPGQATAAQACDALADFNFGGHNDWYLPAVSEAYDVITQLKERVPLNGPVVLGAQAGVYWTSSESSAVNAIAIALTQRADGSTITPSNGPTVKSEAKLYPCVRMVN